MNQGEKCTVASDTDKFKLLKEIVFSESRKIAIAERSNGDYWFNEWVSGPTYIGFTSKGFGIPNELMPKFISALQGTIADTGTKEVRINIATDKELIVWRPAPNQIDIRQWINSEKYTGYTKKGLRFVNSNAAKLLEAIKELQERPEESTVAPIDNPRNVHNGSCLACGTTSRHVFSHGLCQVCYERENRTYSTTPTAYVGIHERVAEHQLSEEENSEALMHAIAIHGRKCYVCQVPYNSLHKNITVYYADNNKANLDDNNIYPVCRNCILTVSSH